MPGRAGSHTAEVLPPPLRVLWAATGHYPSINLVRTPSISVDSHRLFPLQPATVHFMDKSPRIISDVIHLSKVGGWTSKPRELSFSSWEDNSDVLFCKGKKVDRFLNPEKCIFHHWLMLQSSSLSDGKWVLWFIESLWEARFLRAGTDSPQSLCRDCPSPRRPGQLGVGHRRCRALCVSRPVALQPIAPTSRPHSSEPGLTPGACIASLSSWTHVAKAVTTPWVWQFG